MSNEISEEEAKALSVTMMTVVFKEPISHEAAESIKADIEEFHDVAYVDAEMGLIIRRESHILRRIEERMGEIMREDLKQFALDYASNITAREAKELSMSNKNTTWRVATEQRRAALEALGMQMPYCLSGEPDECGADDIGHFAAYTATLMAQTQWDMSVMERACPGQGTGQLTAETFAEQCHDLRPDGFDCEELALRDQFNLLVAAVEDDEE